MKASLDSGTDLSDLFKSLLGFLLIIGALLLFAVFSNIPDSTGYTNLPGARTLFDVQSRRPFDNYLVFKRRRMVFVQSGFTGYALCEHQGKIQKQITLYAFGKAPLPLYLQPSLAEEALWRTYFSQE